MAAKIKKKKLALCYQGRQDASKTVNPSHTMISFQLLDKYALVTPGRLRKFQDNFCIVNYALIEIHLN